MTEATWRQLSREHGGEQRATHAAWSSLPPNNRAPSRRPSESVLDHLLQCKRHADDFGCENCLRYSIPIRDETRCDIIYADNYGRMKTNLRVSATTGGHSK